MRFLLMTLRRRPVVGEPAVGVRGDRLLAVHPVHPASMALVMLLRLHPHLPMIVANPEFHRQQNHLSTSPSSSHTFSLTSKVSPAAKPNSLQFASHLGSHLWLVSMRRSSRKVQSQCRFPGTHLFRDATVRITVAGAELHFLSKLDSRISSCT